MWAAVIVVELIGDPVDILQINLVYFDLGDFHGIPTFFEKNRLEIVAANNAGLAAKIARRPIIL